MAQVTLSTCPTDALRSWAFSVIFESVLTDVFLGTHGADFFRKRFVLRVLWSLEAESFLREKSTYVFVGSSRAVQSATKVHVVKRDKSSRCYTLSLPLTTAKKGFTRTKVQNYILF